MLDNTCANDWDSGYWNKMIDNKTEKQRLDEFEKGQQKKKHIASCIKARSKRKNKNKKK